MLIFCFYRTTICISNKNDERKKRLWVASLSRTIPFIFTRMILLFATSLQSPLSLCNVFLWNFNYCAGGHFSFNSNRCDSIKFKCMCALCYLLIDIFNGAVNQKRPNKRQCHCKFKQKIKSCRKEKKKTIGMSVAVLSCLPFVEVFGLFKNFNWFLN